MSRTITSSLTLLALCLSGLSSPSRSLDHSGGLMGGTFHDGQLVKRHNPISTDEHRVVSE